MKFTKLVSSLLEKIGIIIRKDNHKSEETVHYPQETIELTATEFKETVTSDKNDSVEETTQSTYAYGTIIWAKRYFNDEERLSIPEGHREGPFVIINNIPDGSVCLYATGATPKSGNFYSKVLILHELEYSSILKKRTYVRVDKSSILTDNEIISVQGELNEREKHELTKKLALTYEDDATTRSLIPYKHIHLEAGDIIKVDGRPFLIIRETEDKNYECMPITKSNDEPGITIEGVKYKVDFKNPIIIPSTTTRERMSCLNHLQMQIINNQYQSFLDYKERYGKIERGSVVTQGKKFYYINGDVSNMFTGYKIKKGTNKNLANFFIDGEEFSSDFTGRVEFPKKDHEYHFYTNATEKEMDRIKRVKKEYQKTHQGKSKKQPKKDTNNDQIESGSIVSILSNGFRYIVITRQDNNLIAIRESDYIEGEYHLVKLNIYETVYQTKMKNTLFKELLIELSNSPEYTKGHISAANLKKLIRDNE